MEERTTGVRAAERRLERARAELKQAMSRLAAVRRAALYGEHDADALDDAVLTCRDLQATVRAARLDLEREWSCALEDPDRATNTVAALPTDDAGVTPVDVTPRLLFARWLVQTGRLTEEVALPAAA